MLRGLKALWQARKGFRWSLYFVDKCEGLRYALHENSVILLLGYVLAPIENGKHISDDWTLHLNFNLKQKSIPLIEGYFSTNTIAPELLAKIAAIDPGWMVESGIPVFVDARTRAALPLGSYGVAFQTESERLQSIERMLSGSKDQPSLDTVMREVFLRS